MGILREHQEVWEYIGYNYCHPAAWRGPDTAMRRYGKVKHYLNLAAVYLKTTVFTPFSSTRRSIWYFSARASTWHSVSRPMAASSSGR